ncbi:unnamed protein product, partial [Oikopleura dioica]
AFGELRRATFSRLNPLMHGARGNVSRDAPAAAGGLSQRP